MPTSATYRIAGCCGRPTGKLEEAGVTSTRSRLGISINANDVSIKCLIDTGARVELLHVSVFKEMCNLSGRPRLLLPAPPTVTISGKPIRVLGRTEIDFKELGILSVVIVEGLLHDCGLWGADVAMEG